MSINSYRIEKDSKYQDATFSEVVPDAGLLFHLCQSKLGDSVSQRSKAGEAGDDKSADTKGAPSVALKSWIYQDDDRC